MVELTPEERHRIYLEEKERIEAQEDAATLPRSKRSLKPRPANPEADEAILEMVATQLGELQKEKIRIVASYEAFIIPDWLMIKKFAGLKAREEQLKSQFPQAAKAFEH